jgi:voltage-gated potassium channel
LTGQRLLRRPRTKSRFQNRVRRAVETRRIFPFLAIATAVMALGVGFIMTLIDHRDFPTFGDAVWWAVVTLGTVGYGDIVPHTGWGRFLGSLVIVLGVTFIAFLTATVTSLFVSADQAEAQARRDEANQVERQETRQMLTELGERLTSIEAKLDARPDAEQR